MSLINLFILSYFGMILNKETIGACVFLIYLMLIYGWVGYFYPIHKNRHCAYMQNEQRKTSIRINRTFICVLVTSYHQNFISFKSKWQSPKIHDPISCQ